MIPSPRIAVLGTGLVGREMLSTLIERAYPAKSVRALASARSAGGTVPYGDTSLRIEDAAHFDFREVDLVLMSAGKEASATFGERAAEQGAYVIDNGSHFRLDKDVPLVVPEVNPAAILQAGKRRIIANPNCSTIQLAVALGPLCERAELVRVVLSTYQSVSGAGERGLSALAAETAALLNATEVPPPHFTSRIAFNCIAQIDQLMPDGSTFEEQKMRAESRKILSLPALGVAATCVRVPTFAGHAISFVAEFEGDMDAARAIEAWQEAPGIEVFGQEEAREGKDGSAEPARPQVPTNIEAVGQDRTLIGRIRDDDSRANTIAAFCLADNLRKGAAVNAVQIAELLLAAVSNGALPPLAGHATVRP